MKVNMQSIKGAVSVVVRFIGFCCRSQTGFRVVEVNREPQTDEIL